MVLSAFRFMASGDHFLEKDIFIYCFFGRFFLDKFILNTHSMITCFTIYDYIGGETNVINTIKWHEITKKIYDIPSIELDNMI